jgi:hypothetical protein
MNKNLHYENEQELQMSSRIHEENGDGHDLDLPQVYRTNCVSVGAELKVFIELKGIFKFSSYFT